MWEDEGEEGSKDVSQVSDLYPYMKWSDFDEKEKGR